MPTYINESNYAQMNRLGSGNGPQHNPNHYANARLGFDPIQNLDCKQIFHHVQNCPVCQHVFTLPKQPQMSSSGPSSLTSSNKIEIPITTLIVFAILIIILFVYIIKTR